MLHVMERTKDCFTVLFTSVYMGGHIDYRACLAGPKLDILKSWMAYYNILTSVRLFFVKSV
uniref:Uncharacterized protein n=1 Tax=Aegilops tauschii subsp. strangulata TaxID=200361 RepID=A0A453HJN6_AEGTS